MLPSLKVLMSDYRALREDQKLCEAVLQGSNPVPEETRALVEERWLNDRLEARGALEALLIFHGISMN